MHKMSEGAYEDWPLIELFGVGPDGTCHCKEGKTCRTPGKHPREKNWETRDRVDVGVMLFRRPRANLGVRTGKPAGFWVLDIDPSGMPAMAALRDEHGALPPTRVHQTGGGTYHYFFAMPADFDVTNRRGSLPKGIDVRGTGGQVVLPPSRTDKGPYSIVRDLPIADAPDWLLDLIRPSGTVHEPDVAQPSAVVTGEHVQTEREAKYERSIIEGEIARLQAMTKAATPNGEGYQGDPWDTTTYMTACQLFELANARWSALTPDEASTIVFAEAPRDEIFDDTRIREKIASARRKVGDKARPAPADNTSWMDAVGEPPMAESATPSQKAVPTRRHDPSDFFGKEGLLAVDLAQAVMDIGPIRWGQNGRWWTFDPRGVWVEDREAVGNRCIDILGNRYRLAHGSNAEAIVRRFAEPLIIDAPDASRINFRNGMLDWRNGTLEAHAADQVSTVQIPHHYDPDATCPRFDAFLDSVMSPDYQHLAWEAIGYLLYSGNPLQVAFLLHGTGGNGKGTLIKVITAMLGTENLAHQSLDALNGDKFAAASLFGKIANIAGDIDATFQESTARFKMLTGEDRFSGEYKYGDSFGFDNFAVPLFSANKIPGSADVSKGYLRRWVNIEFDRTFTGDPIPGLGESLAATEVPGVIAKALTYLGPLLAAGHFTIKGEAEKGREEFALSIDQVRQWFDAECMPDPDDPFVKQDELYRDYRFWAERNGNGRLKASDFYSRLEGMGYARAKVRGIRGFRGIRMMLTQGADYRGTDEATNRSWVDEVD